MNTSPFFHVKQVEIIKGPGSAVYGTNAFSGAINIVTYTPEELDGGMVRFQPVHLPDKKSVRWLVIPMEMCHLKFMQEALMSMATGWILIQNEPNLLELKPRRSINGGAQLNWKGLDLRYDFVDYRHTYFFISVRYMGRIAREL